MPTGWKWTGAPWRPISSCSAASSRRSFRPSIRARSAILPGSTFLTPGARRHRCVRGTAVWIRSTPRWFPFSSNRGRLLRPFCRIRCCPVSSSCSTPAVSTRPAWAIGSGPGPSCPWPNSLAPGICGIFSVLGWPTWRRTGWSTSAFGRCRPGAMRSTPRPWPPRRRCGTTTWWPMPGPAGGWPCASTTMWKRRSVTYCSACFSISRFLSPLPTVWSGWCSTSWISTSASPRFSAYCSRSSP